MEKATHIQLPHDLTDVTQLRRVLDRILELIDEAYSTRGDVGFQTKTEIVEDDTLANIQKVILDLDDTYVKLDSSNISKVLKLKGVEFALVDKLDMLRYVPVDSSHLVLPLVYRDYDSVKADFEARGLSLSDIYTQDEIIAMGQAFVFTDNTLIPKYYVDDNFILLDSSNLNDKLTYQSAVTITDDNDLVNKLYVDNNYVEQGTQATPSELDSTATLDDVITKVNDLITLLENSKITQ